ncbi:MAG: hypothetical protein HWN66_08225 [Candidatus Helarchaeota archaeon]|nr:hypothetical protein [Candidatus Helarchaeota archaeon]
MKQKVPLNGIILSVVDEKGPHPKIWYPNFASLSEIHNSALKSFSIMIGDKSYREKTPRELTCFGVLPFPDMKAVGFIYFSGYEDPRPKNPLPSELPTTITLLFHESYRDEICQKSPQIHQFLEKETKNLWPLLQKETLDPNILSQLHDKLLTFLEKL